MGNKLDLTEVDFPFFSAAVSLPLPAPAKKRCIYFASLSHVDLALAVGNASSVPYSTLQFVYFSIPRSMFQLAVDRTSPNYLLGFLMAHPSTSVSCEEQAAIAQ